MTITESTTTALIPFYFHDHTLSVLTDQHGEPWWIASEVCAVLELDNVSRAVSRLDADEKTDLTLSDVTGRPQEMLIINESGLYSLILGSRKKSAKDFKRWVTHEVLPQIRKTGKYTTDVDRTLTTSQALLQQVVLLGQQVALIVQVEERQQILEARQEEQATEIAEIKARRPPHGKVRIEDWLRREAKPYLEPTLMRHLREACSRRERPAEFRPEGMDWPLRYYRSETIGDAYDEVTRQLRFLTYDPGVAYRVRRKG